MQNRWIQGDCKIGTHGHRPIRLPVYRTFVAHRIKWLVKTADEIQTNYRANLKWIWCYSCRCVIRTDKPTNICQTVDEWKTNLMSLAILFHFLCAQHVSDINISIFRSLRLCCWITTSVVLFSIRCVLEFLVRLVLGGVRVAGFSLRNEHHSKPPAPKAPTHNELRTRRPMW